MLAEWHKFISQKKKKKRGREERKKLPGKARDGLLFKPDVQTAFIPSAYLEAITHVYQKKKREKKKEKKRNTIIWLSELVDIILLALAGDRSYEF